MALPIEIAVTVLDCTPGAGEGVLPVARKLGISRKLLHDRVKAEDPWA
jgi:hypothetical protein